MSCRSLYYIKEGGSEILALHLVDDIYINTNAIVAGVQVKSLKGLQLLAQGIAKRRPGGVKILVMCALKRAKARISAL